MALPAVMSSARTYPLPVEQTFDAVLPLPLEQLFNHRYGPLPPIRGTEDAPAVWGAVGQTRLVRLAGGGSMREELVRVDRPAVFGYTLSDLTGPLALLAARVDGSWSFEPAGTGTRVTWRWSVEPASAVGAAALPALTRLWHGYARQALQRLEELLPL